MSASRRPDTAFGLEALEPTHAEGARVSSGYRGSPTYVLGSHESGANLSSGVSRLHTISDGAAPMVGAVTQTIRNYIVENFLYTRPDFAFGDDDALLGGGIIDSMGVMEVIMFVEQEFGVTVRDEDITEQNLGTVSAIASYVITHARESRLPRSA